MAKKEQNKKGEEQLDQDGVIVVVEDNRFLSALLTEKLRMEGFGVVTCFDGEEGLKKITEEKPRAVLLDLLIPGEMDGFEVLRRVREKLGRGLPIIVLTNLEDKKSVEKALSLGADGYLVKAYSDAGEVMEAVRDVLDRRSRGEIPEDDVEGDVARGGRQVAFKEIKKLRARIEKSLVEPKEVSIIHLVDDLVYYGFLARASDIHINPEEDRLRVRLRIDGVMHDVFVFPKDIQSEVITRIRVLSGLRTDAHQVAQDGRFRAILGKAGSIDIRVSIAPTYFGENCVMRLLAEQAQAFTLETLGFTGDDLKKIYKAIHRPYGMVLATGPTGSGKTTSLYSILKQISTPEVSVITIEDPIEYSLMGVDQIQTNNKTGLTFANGLRFILRQDPDVIMVGEIRDEETASIAINAAMTGHLLLSTLHSNDAATTLPRLLDMKVEAFLIASTINIVISQRLVRVICSDCKKEKELGDVELANLKEFIPESLLGNHRVFYVGKGCDACEGTGYRSRIGIHEILEMSDSIRSLVMKRSNASEIRALAVKEGMATMLDDGFHKALVGVTTVEEVLRVFRE